jgi:propanol-preferring alcohol dehydrogenase
MTSEGTRFKVTRHGSRMNDDVMTALQYTGQGNVALQAVPRPALGDGEVLLRVGAAGICHSDVHVARGESSLPQLDALAPFTLGHEIAGAVVATGLRVDPSLCGMRAAVYAPTGCSDCANCSKGSWNYCDTRDQTSVAGLGLGQDGGLAQYVAVDAGRLVDIGDLPFDVAAVLTDAALTSVHAVSMIARVDAVGSTVVVIGVGGLGHLAVQVLAHQGHRVIAVDNRGRARRVAIDSGAAVFCAPEDLIDIVAKHAGARAASAVLDFVGSEQTLELGERVLGTRGALVVVGSAGGRIVVDKARTGIRRGLSYHVPVWGTLPELHTVIELARQGVLRPVVTRTSLDKAEAGLDALHAGQVTGRLVVTSFGKERSDA